MSKNDKVIINSSWINSDGTPYLDNGKTATIIKGPDRFNQYIVSLDSFPNCNHREYHNKFQFDEIELTLITE